MALKQKRHSSSDEKLQSLKQELAAVKQQLAEKQQELTSAGIVDLLASAEVAMLSLDRELCLWQFTPYAAKLLGLMETDKGRTISSLALDYVGDDLPDQARLVLETASSMEDVFTSSDGSHFLRRLQPCCFTKDGQIEGIVITFINISRHLEALRSSEERGQAIMDNASEAIVVTGGDGVITDFNIAAENLFGYSASEAIGKNVSLLMPSPYREQHDTFIRNYKQTGISKIMRQRRELPGRRKDGSIIPLEITVAEIDHRNLFCGMIRDLSEHKLLEREIADICTLEQERIGQDIHDGLGQQLTGLSMMATSLKHDLEKQQLPQAGQLGEMIDYLNQASEEARKLSHGLAPISIMPQGLSDALKKLAENIRTTTGILCHFESDQSIENMDVTFSMQLYRIAQEAVNNAVKYANPKIIRIKLESADGYVLTVSDDGRGFDVDEMMPKRFGLRIMRYRAGIIGFKLEIRSSPGEGTIIQCRQEAVVQ